MGDMKKSNRRVTILSHAVLLIVLLFSLYPFILMIMNSLKSSQEININPMGFPQELHLENYINVWIEGGYAKAFLNTTGIMVITIIAVLVLCGCCAYGLAKLKPKGANGVFTYFMFTMSIPVTLCLVPLFFVWMRLNLMNTHLGLVLIYVGTNIPFTVIIMRSFFIGIPDEILESARIDGCDEFKALAYIAFPIAKPIFLTSALMTALSVWNEFFYANSFIQSDNLRTVATRYLAFTGRYSTAWDKVSTAGVISLLPMVILYLIFQRQFIEGLTGGSVKG
jgi:ABC-type sugar transport system, permease component